MPRLLLVDDNPSIHRIAESLLAPTDVELVCVDSAAAALELLERGERFDVALVDTAMPGMDGWALLVRLREMEATARLPIALMAGVLDPVDPAKLAKAPVQGFLKKPIELRELGDRVKALLATPVAAAPEPAPFRAPEPAPALEPAWAPEPEPRAIPSPFSTVPATSTRDLARMVEPDLPEFRPEPPAPFQAPELDDLLVLEAGDLWPEEAPAPPPVAALAEPPAPEPPPAPEVRLELEELDLESLQSLAVEPLPVPPAPPAPAAPVEVAEPMDLSDLADFDALPVEADLAPAPPALPASLPPLPPEEEPSAAGFAALAGLIAEPVAGAWTAHAHVPEVQQALVAAPAAARPEIPAPEPSEAPHVHVPAEPVVHVPAEPVAVPAPAGEPAAAGQGPAAAGQAVQAQALVQALLADPVLVDALVQAVVARMGDRAIREIAWEIMPDLAGRLQK